MRGAVLSPTQTGWRLTRLQAVDLVDLAAVRRALTTVGGTDALAAIEINHDCAIRLRHSEGRERLCIFQLNERYFYTLAWDVVTALGAVPSIPDILLPIGDPTLLVDLGVSQDDVRRFLTGDQGAEGFVTEIVDALGVGAKFHKLFAAD